MKRLAVWLDRFAEEACTGLDQALAMRGALVLRCFDRTPRPAASRQLSEFRQVVVLGGDSVEARRTRAELATTTLTCPVIVLTTGDEPRTLYGAGVVDVLRPQRPAAVAERVELMSEVPIVSSAGARVGRGVAGAPAALDAQLGERAAPARPAPPDEESARVPTSLPAGDSRPAPGVVPSAEASGSSRVLAIVSSTGGAFVAADLLRALSPRARPAVLLAQHLEAEFVPFFAEWLAGACGWPVKVVARAEPLTGGVVYLAAGGHDLAQSGREVTARPASSRFVPSGDALLESVAGTSGVHGVGVVLSGMGADGSRGLASLAKAGGRALCQAPESAVVSSMPARALQATPTAQPCAPERLALAIELTWMS